jgi:hypothetical protein
VIVREGVRGWEFDLEEGGVERGVERKRDNVLFGVSGFGGDVGGVEDCFLESRAIEDLRGTVLDGIGEA